MMNRPGMFAAAWMAASLCRCEALVAPSSGRPRSLVVSRLGRVSLVGAGPGDPDLLTVGALRAISDPAALVVADRLVSAEILSLVAGELKIAGKRPGCAEVAQQEIYSWVREGVLANRTVVRLKIGDPFVFGRGGEEILELRESLGIEATVVPGVSAALAAGVPVTHRGVAHQVVITTGYGRNGSHPDLPEYRDYQTVVFLMSVGRVGRVARELVDDRAFPPDTPALVVEKASCPEQRIVIGDLSDVAHLVEIHDIKPPATVVFGNAVRVLYPDHPHGLVQAATDDPIFDVTNDLPPRPAISLLPATAAPSDALTPSL